MDTKKLRQKILDLAIRGKLVPQDPNDEPASVLLERIRAEKERLISEGKIKRPKKSKATSSESHYQNFEQPFEIPESWEWVRLGDLTSKIGSGSTPKGSNYSEQGIPFFRSQNIHNHGLVYDDIKYISQSINESMSGTIVHANDLLLNITGGSIGRCAVVPYNFEEGNVSQHVCIIRPLLVSSDYLHFYILSDLFWKSMQLTGSGREGLPKYNLEKMSLPVPPLEEQHRIVEAIKKYNTIVSAIEDSSNGILNDISYVKSRILELAMQGRLVPQDPTDEPAAEMLKRINPKAKIITDNPHSWNVPNGWSIAKLKDIANLVTGSTPSKSNSEYYGNEYPFYKPQDLDKNIVSEASEYLSEMGFQASRNIPKNSIAICCIGTIGKVGFINRAGATNQQINTILPNPSFYPKFLYYYCKAKIFQDIILSLSAAITISIVNKGKMGEILILLPPLEEQKRIVAKIEELYSVLDKIEASLQS